jgi:hypothetical protein
MAIIGSIGVSIKARTRDLEKGLKKAQGRLGKFGGAVAKVGVGLAALAAVGIARVVAGFREMVKESFVALDALGKLSDRINISVQDLRRFEFAAKITGSSVEKFQKGIEKMVNSIGEAIDGVGEGREQFKKMGIDVQELARLDAAGQFITIARGIRQLNTEAEKLAALRDIMGRVGGEFKNLVDTGEAGVQRLFDRLDRIAGKLTREQIKQIENANDAVVGMDTATTKFAEDFALAMAGAKERAADFTTELVVQRKELDEVAARALAAGRTQIQGPGSFALFFLSELGARADIAAEKSMAARRAVEALTEPAAVAPKGIDIVGGAKSILAAIKEDAPELARQAKDLFLDLKAQAAVERGARRIGANIVDGIKTGFDEGVPALFFGLQKAVERAGDFVQGKLKNLRSVLPLSVGGFQTIDPRLVSVRGLRLGIENVEKDQLSELKKQTRILDAGLPLRVVP